MTPLLLVLLVTLWNTSAQDSSAAESSTSPDISDTTTTTVPEDIDSTMLGDPDISTPNGSSTTAFSTTATTEEGYSGMNMSVNATEDVNENRITSVCSSGSCFGWDKYYRLADIYGYLDYLQKKYPDLMKVETIGLTAERRPINLVRIHSSTNKTKNNAVWVDAGVHAREWITPAAAMYILDEILASLDAKNSTFSGLDYYVVPMMNPDGYEYSHSTDRLWRKNRSLNNGSSCVGTDLNRNWGYKWGGTESSSDPCSSNYRGPFAFSESESASASKYILKKKTQIKAYLSLHSYGQSILFPWAYTSIRTADFKDLYDLAYYMAYKVKTNGGENYRFGTVAATFYLASGGSQDWIKAKAGVKYSYTMELRDNGRYAFDLPVDQILKTSQDAYSAFTVLAQKVKTGKYFI